MRVLRRSTRGPEDARPCETGARARAAEHARSVRTFQCVPLQVLAYHDCRNATRGSVEWLLHEMSSKRTPPRAGRHPGTAM
jgi:hypothetical protein